MLAFRSLAVGLLGACFLLLVSRPATQVRVERELVPVLQAPPPTATIIDVAPGLTAIEVARLVHLQGDEHVVAVDDRPVSGDLDAGSVIATIEPRSNRFVDLTVASATGARRILVLMH